MSFRGLLDRFYRRKTDGYTVVILGLDGAGKTTMLYKLVLGKIVTTIPTIGLNVETVKAPTTSGRDLTITVWDVGLGCGTHHFVPIVVNYAVYADAIIWMVDSTQSSSEILDESVELLGRLLRSPAFKAKGCKAASFPILL
jgi:GTPase SAR1 family protein